MPNLSFHVDRYAACELVVNPKRYKNMINIIGVVIIASGFLAPYVSNGRFSPIILFWIGGLLLLNKGVLIKTATTWTKWARIGIVAHIALILIMIPIFYLTVNVSMMKLGYWLTMVPFWLSRPATALSPLLSPVPGIHHSDGSVTFHMGFARAVIADFLDVVLFALAAVVIGLIRQKRLRNGEG
jgi:hypothetical protein